LINQPEMRSGFARSFARQVGALLLGLASAVVPALVVGQAHGFPGRAVTLVVPFPPGGSSDSTARILAERMASEWRQPVVVENRPGAGTTVAAAHVARAPATGHTLFLVAPGTHAVSSALYPNLPYDPLRSFAAVSQVAQAPFIFVVNASSAIRSIADLVQTARDNPGKVTYGSSGSGAGPHLITERFALSRGLTLVHVPYNGAAQAMLAAAAGQVDFTLADTAAVPQIQSGRLRGLAVTSVERSPLFPELPTLAEAGVADLVYPLTVGIVAPAGTEPRIVNEINRVVRVALEDAEVRRRMQVLGLEIRHSNPKEFEDLLGLEVQRYKDIVRSIGLKLQ
jgi:tripartite-type tricarboxylate transporter receptor subunit TctC